MPPSKESREFAESLHDCSFRRLRPILRPCDLPVDAIPCPFSPPKGEWSLPHSRQRQPDDHRGKRPLRLQGLHGPRRFSPRRPLPPSRACGKSTGVRHAPRRMLDAIRDRPGFRTAEHIPDPNHAVITGGGQTLPIVVPGQGPQGFPLSLQGLANLSCHGISYGDGCLNGRRARWAKRCY
jgi:hypothetical protein